MAAGLGRRRPRAAAGAGGGGRGVSGAAPGAVRGGRAAGDGPPHRPAGAAARGDAVTATGRARLGALGGAAVLAVLLWQLGTGAFVDGVRRLDAPVLLAALGLGLLTTVCSAWRWCLVARGLGIRLPFGRAVTDYYRSLFLNAALPGGVLGDVHRAVSHGRSSGDVGRGVRAVVLERLAGQGVLVAAGVVFLLVLPSPVPAALDGAAGRLGASPGTVLVLAVAAGAAAFAVVRLRRGPRGERRLRAVRALLGEARRALLSRRNGPGVALSSAVVLTGYLAMFLLAARAAGATAPAAELLPLLVLALLAMALPLNVAGWGPREGVTAWAFGVSGLGAAQGLTVAVVYGLLSLTASLPGVLVLLVRWGAGLRRPQVEFEEGVHAETGAADRGPERVPHPLRAREAQPGHAVAEQHGRDGDVEPVERVLVEEAGDRDAAALDEDPAEPAPGERPHEVARGERGPVREDQHLHALREPAGPAVRRAVPGRARTGLTTVGGFFRVPGRRPALLPRAAAVPGRADHPQGGCRPVGEHPQPGAYPAVRVEDDAHRVGAGAGADGQPGVVRRGRAGADEDRVGERAHPVQMGPVLLTGDIVGVAGTARDEPVEALPELGERQPWTGQAQRQVAAGQLLRRGRGALLLPPPPGPAGTPDETGGAGLRLGADGPQPVPGR
ncbi:hypothetical protein HCK00_03270 [Streptomyces sp. PLAI1-29]|uniref:Uncharacterized protein n=1 Tax=Streptomyces zingiberis TaxID=2053010 RepID=A0ABX1BV07_9ACTN|nr:hypothetical protein [Streptomyces zingiberis]